MSTFECGWVNNMMSVETDGWTRPCCLETGTPARIADISEGILIAFNHPKLIELHTNLTDGYSAKTRNFCHRCEKLENNNQVSMRNTTNILKGPRELKTLQFKMSNKCQLACAHCGPDKSSTWAKLQNISPHVIDSFKVTDAFLNELKDLLPQLDVLKFSGGEPFLDPNHWKILDALKGCDRGHCKLEYITNGLIKPKHELWQGWGNVECSVSADGFEESFEWFRRGANWNELIISVDSLSNHADISINFSVTPYTIQDYHAAKNYWKYPFSSLQIVYPTHADLFQFPREQFMKLENYQTIPGYDSTMSSGGNLNKYRMWAHTWDSKWNTVGWANRIFDWMTT